MKIDINKKQDVICEAGNIYTHSRRLGTYYCFSYDAVVRFIILCDGLTYYFDFSERQEFTRKGKLLSIETHL